MDIQEMNAFNDNAEKSKKLMNYTSELNALNRLSNAGLIDSDLKQKILEDIRKSYGIISNLTAQND